MAGGGDEVDGNGQALSKGTAIPARWPNAGSTVLKKNRGSAQQPIHLSVVGIELPADLVRRILHGLDGQVGPDEETRIAAALGYIAHILDRLSFYLDIPLRFPLTPAMSKSILHDPAPLVVPEQSSVEIGSNLIARGFSALADALTQPWDLGGAPGSGHRSRGRMVAEGGEADATRANPSLDLDLFSDPGWQSNNSRYALAVHLLSKNVEQLIMAHAGLSVAAPNQVLQNLYVLVTAAQAALGPCR